MNLLVDLCYHDYCPQMKVPKIEPPRNLARYDAYHAYRYSRKVIVRLSPGEGTQIRYGSKLGDRYQPVLTQHAYQNEDNAHKALTGFVFTH